MTQNTIHPPDYSIPSLQPGTALSIDQHHTLSGVTLNPAPSVLYTEPPSWTTMATTSSSEAESSHDEFDSLSSPSRKAQQARKLTMRVNQHLGISSSGNISSHSGINQLSSSTYQTPVVNQPSNSPVKKFLFDGVELPVHNLTALNSPTEKVGPFVTTNHFVGSNPRSRIIFYFFAHDTHIRLSDTHSLLVQAGGSF